LVTGELKLCGGIVTKASSGFGEN